MSFRKRKDAESYAEKLSQITGRYYRVVLVHSATGHPYAVCRVVVPPPQERM